MNTRLVSSKVNGYTIPKLSNRDVNLNRCVQIKRTWEICRIIHMKLGLGYLLSEGLIELLHAPWVVARTYVKGAIDASLCRVRDVHDHCVVDV